jgi:hypothetical protein
MRTAFRHRRLPPPTRFAVWASGLECTLADLVYTPVVTREEGLAALRRS